MSVERPIAGERATRKVVFVSAMECDGCERRTSCYELKRLDPHGDLVPMLRLCLDCFGAISFFAMTPTAGSAPRSDG